LRNFLTLLLFGFLSRLSLATLVVPETPESLAVKAPIVAYGFVTQIQVNPETGYRTAVFEALDLAKSFNQRKKQKEFLVELTNRAIPKSQLVELVSGAPELKLGEEVVLFLRPIEARSRRRSDQKSFFSIEGFYQGKMRVVRDSQGVRRALAWNSLPAEQGVSMKALYHQKSTHKLKVDQIKSQNSGDESLKEARTLDSILNFARENSQLSEAEFKGNGK
jgi:hypothetical protein